MAFPALIPLLVQLASTVPSLMKYAGAGSKSTEIAEKVVGIAQAVTGVADPEAAVKQVIADPVKAAEFQLKATEQMIVWDQIYLADVQSARDRDAKLAQAGYRNVRAHSMYILAIAVIVCMVYIIWKDPGINEFMKGIFTLVLGRFLGYLDNIYNFEFGTTRGSKQKDDTIEKLTKTGHL